ncbi:MAG: DUF1702 family protein [Candidatus Poribacteria bacterium]|nr:DUF1702 family protein [Candidatus Poribacteria bacterium]
MGKTLVAGISFLGDIRKHLLGISPQEVTFSRRGFRKGPVGAQQRLEEIGHTFLVGYHAALLDDEPEILERRLFAVDIEHRGFAFEGAAMGLCLLDYLSPFRRKRLYDFLSGPGEAHVYMMHVGVGWVLARLPWLRLDVTRALARLDPLLRWLAQDGYGFHSGYFHWPRFVEGHVTPKRLSDYAMRVFDQGLGRSLWFVDGADVERIPKTIKAFAPPRHEDLWAGVGLACAYAGGVDGAAIETLRTQADVHQSHMAQGAAFAAKARQRARNPAPHTELACEILCGTSAKAAAYITDVALKDLPSDSNLPAYEVWRRRIRDHFTKENKR